MNKAVFGLGVLVCAPAWADWHGGLDLRADSSAHPVRIGAGVDAGSFDTLLVLDPMVVFDHQFDADLLATKPVGSGWGVFGGWRTSVIGIAGGRQYQEKAVVGLSGALPEITCTLRARWAFEMATVVVKHGGGLPTDWIGFAEGRDFVDLINFGMFVTVEYAGR